MIYCPSLSPATTLYTHTYNHLIFIIPAIREVDPLFVSTFLHRFVDILEDFLGSPLVSSKIENSYDVVAQLLSEICDAGLVVNTEANTLKDVVAVPGWTDKLLGGLSLPSGPAPAHGTSNLRPQLLQIQSQGPSLPWRRSNVKHTSNELYVDIVETLQVTLAPSGRPLAAFAYGNILFTAKISGVPDLLLNLSLPGGNKQALARAIEAPVFHPCVRLSRWRDNPGELSFIPPDGKFMLAGYEVNLLPETEDLTTRSTRSLNLPATVEVRKSQGVTGMDFEVRLTISDTFAAKGGSGAAAAQLRAISGPAAGRGSGRNTPSLFGSRDSGTSNSPTLQDVAVTIPVPKSVRNVTDLRASRGDASFSATDSEVEWRISGKDALGGGVATLKCTVVGQIGDNDLGDDATNGFDYATPSMGDYDENEDGYQGAAEEAKVQQAAASAQARLEERDAKRVAQNKQYMPTTALVSFGVKGWLASGLKVDSLVIDVRKSRGLGEGVKPVKGAKYLTISKKGIEARC